MNAKRHPTDKLYRGQPDAHSGPWRLSRDGAEILTGTQQECWAWIHSHTSFSVDWATKWEGYRIEPVRVGP